MKISKNVLCVVGLIAAMALATALDAIGYNGGIVWLIIFMAAALAVYFVDKD